MDQLTEQLRRIFDRGNSLVVIRVMAGLFYFPHIIYKVIGFDSSLVFFAKAGLQPPLLFLVLALICESICAIGLTFNILVRWVGLLCAGTMVVAAYATLATKGIGWFWNKGGIEYLIFWGVTGLCLSWTAWRAHWAAQDQAR